MHSFIHLEDTRKTKRNELEQIKAKSIKLKQLLQTDQLKVLSIQKSRFIKRENKDQRQQIRSLVVRSGTMKTIKTIECFERLI